MGLPLRTRLASNVLLPFAALLTLLAVGATASAQGVPALAKTLNPRETALILIDYQYPFTDPNGANRRAVGKEMDEKKMLERTVELVKKARALGVVVVHVTEGYTKDYRELDPTNPGGFHRGQIMRHAWVTGTKEQSYYEPLLPGPGDKDIVLAPRIQTSAFGGTGLNEMLHARGIKSVGVAGFTSDVCVYATVTNAYDLGYHVYALKDLAVGYFPEQAELMVKNTYPMWSKVLTSDEWVAMLDGGRLAGQEPAQNVAEQNSR